MTRKINISIILCNIVLSMLVIYLSPRFDILTLFGLIVVNLIIYFLLALKDKKVKDRINKKIEEIFELLHSLDPSKNNYEVIDDEFGKLRDEIVKIIIENKVLVKKSEEKQEILREYTEDIAHQIKTPITGALLMLDLIEEDSENNQEYIDYMRKSLNRLHGLVDALLKMASLDSEMVHMQKETVKVKDLLEGIQQEFKNYFGNQKSWIPIYGENFYLLCDPQWTYEAIFNIVKNGLEASPEKGLEIHLKQTNIYKSIYVKDFSEGLSDEMLKKAFKRFYKKNPDSKGYGIGLPMAKSIMEKQNGELLYYRNKESNCFELRFYK